MRTCQVHLGLSGDDLRLKPGNFDTCNIVQATVHLDGGCLDVVANGVLHVVAGHVHGLRHGKEAVLHDVAHARLLVDNLLQNLPALRAWLHAAVAVAEWARHALRMQVGRTYTAW